MSFKESDEDSDEDAAVGIEEGEAVRKASKRKEMPDYDVRKAPVRQGRDAGISRPSRDAFNKALIKLLAGLESNPKLRWRPENASRDESLLDGFRSTNLLRQIEDYKVGLLAPRKLVIMQPFVWDQEDFIQGVQVIVPEKDWILLDGIKKKCTTKVDMYTSVSGFLADWDRLVANTIKVRPLTRRRSTCID